MLFKLRASDSMIKIMIALAIFILSIIIAFFLSTILRNSAVIKIISIILDTILTIALIWIYMLQKNIMDEQSRSQKIQTRLMEANHDAAIDWCEFEFERQDNNQIDIWISNLGNGIAQNIRIETNIEIEESKYEGGTKIQELEITDPNEERGGSILQTSEESIQFTGTLAISVWDKNRETKKNMTINAFLSELWNESATVSIEVNIIYRNIIGENGKEHLFKASDVDVFDGMTLSDIETDVFYTF